MVKVTKIVILGGGFVGIRAAQDLAEKCINAGIKREIVVVDKESTHIYRSDLYEVATAFNKKITDSCMLQLKETVATPIYKLLFGRGRFIHDEVIGIDGDKRIVHLKDSGALSYDYLIVAMGSENNYFGIPGLRQNAMTMKTVADALKFNCHLDGFFAELKKKRVSRTVNIVIGGGGATGVEMAGELIGSLKKLCAKYKYDCRKVNVELIEGTEKLLGMDKEGTALVLARLKKLGVVVSLQTLIKKVEKKEIVLKGKDGKLKKKFYDILVWTGGVMVNPVVSAGLGEKKYGGAILVNPFLQSYEDRNVFAGGDNAFFEDTVNPGKRLPMLGSVAVEQGEILAENIFRLSQGKEMKAFVPGKMQMVIPIGGKYAVWKSGERLFSGNWVWLLKRIVYLKYALSILPFWKAVRKWLRSTEIFIDND
ncbi:MAG: NAD(P)/FAD-dependent oxidoreductase [Candidatus Peregrinibacteria bacterium]|nr:NAD(P)/FAD-dependent oxidoreductase [Candidatus Peregrinibacteria bacterium]